MAQYSCFPFQELFPRHTVASLVAFWKSFCCFPAEFWQWWQNMATKGSWLHLRAAEINRGSFSWLSIWFCVRCSVLFSFVKFWYRSSFCSRSIELSALREYPPAGWLMCRCNGSEVPGETWAPCQLDLSTFPRGECALIFPTRHCTKPSSRQLQVLGLLRGKFTVQKWGLKWIRSLILPNQAYSLWWPSL